MTWHYTHVVGTIWKKQPSVYGPFATWIQSFAAWIGGANVATTIWILMILNGIVFIGVGFLLLKTSDDPVRATLFWTANPVIIQQLVSGGHLDTFVAAAAICSIQVARWVTGRWGDVLIGVLIGLACGVKINAVLIGIGLAWPLLRRREWMRTARIAAVSLATVALQYSFYGLSALKPLVEGSKWVALPSPWWLLQVSGEAIGVDKSTMATIIGLLWPIAMIVVAGFIYRRISSDQPREVVAPFALTFAWLLVAPWVFPWYAAIAWAALTQIPRNRMTRWLALATVFLALWHSSGGHGAPGRLSDRGIPQKAAAVVRRHWLAAALLAAGVVLRVLAQLAYRPALFYIDTTRYLYNAQGNDPVGYKGPLRAILLTANFDAVAAVQHLLGLAMAVVIYLLLLRRGAARWLAALAIAPVLLDGYQLQTEQTIMPGTLSEALIVTGLAILLWSPKASWRRAAAAGLVLGISATVAQVDEVLILPAVLYLLGPAAAPGRPSARQLPCARRSPCPSWPTAPAPTFSPEASSCRIRASRPTTEGWRPPRTARPSGCRLPSGPCARIRHSRPRARTGWSTARIPRYGLTTRACNGMTSTGWCLTSTAGS